MVTDKIRELTQRERERRLKTIFPVIVIISFQPQVVWNGKCVSILQK